MLLLTFIKSDETDIKGDQILYSKIVVIESHHMQPKVRSKPMISSSDHKK